MLLATHKIGSRHFTFGKWREPGELVDASAWPNRAVLEEAGYIHLLPEPLEVEEKTPQAEIEQAAQSHEPEGEVHPEESAEQDLGPEGEPSPAPEAEIEPTTPEEPPEAEEPQATGKKRGKRR